MLTDLRLALRSLSRSAWFTCGATAIFAIGIGLNVAVFSIVDPVLFRPLPYAKPNELVLLRRCAPARVPCGASLPAGLMQAAAPGLSTIAEPAAVGLRFRATRQRADIDSPGLTLLEGSANLLRVLGVTPVLGRDVSREDLDGGHPVALLRHETWRSLFGADPAIIGRQLWWNDRAVTVIGVLPPGFFPPSYSLPPKSDGLLVVRQDLVSMADAGTLTALIARLRPPTTAPTAQAELRALAMSLDAGGGAGDVEPGATIRVDPLGAYLFERYERYSTVFMIGATLVLVIASTNLVGLFVARTRSQAADMSTRIMLGATRRRIVTGLIAEVLLVCTAGASLGLLVLRALKPLMAGVLPSDLAQLSTGLGESRVVVVTAVTTLAAGVAGGIWPGVLALRDGFQSRVFRHSAGQRAIPGGSLLLATQSLLSVTLVVAAVATAWSFGRLVNRDIGYMPRNLYQVLLTAPRQPAPQLLADYQQIVDAVAAIPSVVAAAGSDGVAGGAGGFSRSFRYQELSVGLIEVDAEFFTVIGSTLVAGREFNESEVASRADAAILNMSALALMWPDLQPDQVLGRVVRLRDGESRVVVGVAPDLLRRYDEVPWPTVFVPLGAAPRSYHVLLARSMPGTGLPAETVSDRVQMITPDWRTTSVTEVRASLGANVADPRFRLVVLATFAFAALVLAAAGLYAQAASEAEARRSELGVRLALGATAGDLRRLLFMNIFTPIMMGAAAGLLLAYWAASLLGSFLFDVNARDPRIYVVSVIVLMATAVMAVWAPARRAARTDPATVLRTV